MSAPALLLVASLIACASMALVFGLALRLRNFSIVDVAWSYNFTPIALAYALLAGGAPARRAAIATLAAAWSLRLGTHLLRRITAQHPVEEGRYVELRRLWAAGPRLRFFIFFQAQAVLNVVLSVPFLIACRDPRPQLGILEWTGIALFVSALLGEAVSDRQLAAFKADPSSHARVCDVGPWRYTRHPNYFFEWLVWCAFALFALPSPGGYVAVYCPLLMLYFLLRVTGVPSSEEQALRSRGEAYRDYQRRTSVFVPWFPRPGV